MAKTNSIGMVTLDSGTIAERASAKQSPKKASRRVAEKGSPSAAQLKRARTFPIKPLEESFIHYCQLQFAVDSVDFNLVRRTSEAIRREVEFIDNPAFHTEDADQVILGEDILANSASKTKVKNATLANLPSHLARLCETKLLSPEEERLLFQRMNYLKYRARRLQATLDVSQPSAIDLVRFEALLCAADWHRDRIIEANMRLVISIVKKFVNPNNAFDDLLSDGSVALMRAVEKFDYELGFRFSTYTTQVIRRNAYRTTMQRQKERLRIAGTSDEALLEISDEWKQSSIDEGRWYQLRSRLSDLLNLLDRREKLIIRARFSLGSHRRVQTLQRLADVLGVSKERVRQLEKRALDKLRLLAEKHSQAEAEVAEVLQ